MNVISPYTRYSDNAVPNATLRHNTSIRPLDNTTCVKNGKRLDCTHHSQEQYATASISVCDSADCIKLSRDVQRGPYVLMCGGANDSFAWTEQNGEWLCAQQLGSKKSLKPHADNSGLQFTPDGNQCFKGLLSNTASGRTCTVSKGTVGPGLHSLTCDNNNFNFRGDSSRPVSTQLHIGDTYKNIFATDFKETKTAEGDFYYECTA